MAAASSSQRIEILEGAVANLATLPARVDRIETTLAEFQVEVRQEFAAVHDELQEVRGDMHALHDGLGQRLDGLGQRLDGAESETARQFRMVHEDLVQRITTSEEETRRQMRVLHEDLVQRLKTLGKAR